MADQNSGESAAPPAFETKNLPHGVVPAPVPYVDSTHLDRGETGAVAAPASEAPTTEDKKTSTSRKSTTSTKDN